MLLTLRSVTNIPNLSVTNTCVTNWKDPHTHMRPFIIRLSTSKNYLLSYDNEQLLRGSAADECSVGSDFERHLNEVLSKFNNNAMFSGSGQETGSMFLCYALINHSCSPNVFMNQTLGKETTGELRALRDIKRGEEINDSYIMLGYKNKKQRQDELRNLSFDIKI